MLVPRGGEVQLAPWTAMTSPVQLRGRDKPSQVSLPLLRHPSSCRRGGCWLSEWEASPGLSFVICEWVEQGLKELLP